MSTREQQNEARDILLKHGDVIPSSLRGPLRAVADNSEVGSAEDILSMARAAVSGNDSD